MVVSLTDARFSIGIFPISIRIVVPAQTAGAWGVPTAPCNHCIKPMAIFFVVLQHVFCRVVLATTFRFGTQLDSGGGSEVMATISYHRASSSSAVWAVLPPVAPTGAADGRPSSLIPVPNNGSSPIAALKPESWNCKPADRASHSARSAIVPHRSSRRGRRALQLHPALTLSQ